MIGAKIVVGVPTFRRPESLRRLLESVRSIRGNVDPIVLVADNDCERREGIGVAEILRAESYPFRIVGMTVSERGLSAVRNAIMEWGFGDFQADFVAMVDDDERVDPDWLSALMAMQVTSRADLVFGAIRPEFEVPPPSWIPGQALYWGTTYEDGIAKDAPGAGSILMSRRVYGDLQMRFSEKYSFSGGEDRDFFLRLHEQGGVFAHACDAVSFEFVGRERMTREWAVKRAFRIGSTDAAIALSRRRLTDIVKIPVAAVVAVLGICFFMLAPKRQMRFALLLARQIGKVAGLCGWSSQAYARAAVGVSE